MVWAEKEKKKKTALGQRQKTKQTKEDRVGKSSEGDDGCTALGWFSDRRRV